VISEKGPEAMADVSEPARQVSNLAISNSIIERPITVDHVSEVLCTDSSPSSRSRSFHAPKHCGQATEIMPPGVPRVMDGSDRSLGFLVGSSNKIKQGCLREPCAKLRWKISKDKEQSPVGPTVREHPRHAGGCDNRFAFEATLRSYEKQARCEVPPHLSGSTRSEIKAEFPLPSVQPGELQVLGRVGRFHARGLGSWKPSSGMNWSISV